MVVIQIGANGAILDGDEMPLSAAAAWLALLINDDPAPDGEAASGI